MRGTAEGAEARRKYADAALAALVLLIVGMMILPLPTGLLDVLIASNVSLAVLMMLVAMYVPNGLAFTSFPTVLLVTTLYRLALNVSSTRLILLQADAGEIIYAFGNFVVRGNYVVGAVIFLILTLIQFLVIAKGSERVAEVGARFTLDAMPGKQMSIDAELRSGALTQEEARRKRAEVQRESQFYGAMDGAMKFVKGDAIAGIVITVINILGGLAIGVAMRGMSAGEALKTYGLLTIGDGLVSQIPSLLISVSAGLVTTRVASEEEGASLGTDVASQIFGNPRALAIASAFLLGLAVVPGLPVVPFLILSAVFFFTSKRLREQVAQEAPSVETVAVQKEAERETKARSAMVPLVVPVSVEMAPDIAERCLGEAGDGPLLEEEVPALRDELFVDLGLALPGVRARMGEDLRPGEYTIAIQEVPVARGHVPTGKLLALEDAAGLASLGVQQAEPTIDPLTQLENCWVEPEARDSLEAAGVPVLETSAVIARHLGACVRRRAADFVGLQEVQAMLDQLERAYPALVRNVTPKPVSLPLLTDILRRLVEEGVSIRPMREILEALATYAPQERDPVTLTELVRSALRRAITHQHAPDGVLDVYLIDPEIEEAVRSSIQRTPSGSYLAMPPDMANGVVAAVKTQAPPNSEGTRVLLTQSDVRRFVRRLLESEIPDVVVLSYQELAPEATVQPLGRVTLGAT